MDCNLPGSSVHGVFLTRILERVAISSSRGSSQLRDQTHISCVSCNTGRFFYHWAIRDLPACGWKNPMIGGAWWATVHGAPKTQTWLSTHIHTQHPEPSYLWKAPSSLQCRDPSDISQSTIQIYRHFFCAKHGVNNIKSLLLRNPVSIITKKERTPSFYAVSWRLTSEYPKYIVTLLGWAGPSQWDTEGERMQRSKWSASVTDTLSQRDSSIEETALGGPLSHQQLSPSPGSFLAPGGSLWAEGSTRARRRQLRSVVPKLCPGTGSNGITSMTACKS